ncbi:MAG: ATP-binding protein [Deferrisomatales bacterium]
MHVRPWRNWGLATKLFVSFLFLSLLPIGVMSALSFRHLATIQAVSVQETRTVLLSGQLGRLGERLGQEADRLSVLFSRLQDEAQGLAFMAGAVLAEPGAFRYRNGSHYRLGPGGSYGNEIEDGNSVLFVPQHSPALGDLVEATESLDLVLRPLAGREPRMVLAWVIFEEGLTRAFPWRDFGAMPRDKDYTTWHFYYLAGPDHNPARGEVFTDPYVDPLTGEWMISCLSPVYLGGRHRATAGIDITIQKLLTAIEEIRLSGESSSLLLSGGGGIIAASVNLPLEALGLDSGAPPHGQELASSSRSSVTDLAARLRGGAVESVERLVAGDHLFLVGSVSVFPPGWRLVLLVPENDVVESAYQSVAGVVRETVRVRRNFIHILAFALVGIAGLTWLVLAHQSRGLRTLLSAIRRFGAGELSHRAEGGAGEFGQLAGALNSMAAGLQEKKRELERVHAEMEQSRKLAAVGRLAAGVAHEVNNPLATISTYTQLLRRRPDLSPEARESLQVVEGEIGRIQEKLRNLLDLSRLQSPVKTYLALDPLVQEVAELSRHEAAARGITLEVALGAGGRTLWGDRSGLKQVLWNLLGNAIDAQPSGGRVGVRTGSDGGPDGALRLEVEDDGPGIPETLMPKIFEPFFTTKEVGRGTGLGLAVVYRIVEGHGGRIEVENLLPRGCRFRVVLPRGGEA